MVDTFTPPYGPSTSGTQKKTTLRIKRAQFGDGYSQRARDGLNFQGLAVTLKWEMLQSSDADTIEAFFAAHAGQVFLYTLPLESTAYKWTCASWVRTYPGGGSTAVSADLVQEFDL